MDGYYETQKNLATLKQSNEHLQQGIQNLQEVLKKAELAQLLNEEV